MNPQTNLLPNNGHLREFIAPALKPVRKYQQKVARATFVPLYARFKMKVYFRDGNQKVFYSYDMHYSTKEGVKSKITNEEMGFIKLFRYLKNLKKDDCYLTVMMWCVMGENTSVKEGIYNFEVLKYVRNREPKIHRKMTFTNGKLNWQDMSNANY